MKHWPANESAKIERLIGQHARQDEYAVFDADNTIWYQDLEETLLSYLEQEGIVTKHTIDPSLQIIPFHPNDTLISYGFKLYNIDHKIGYPWFAQIFSGLTLFQLKKHVDDLFALNGREVYSKLWENGQLVKHRFQAPRIYPAQRELINTLQANGIEVYVITAALEDLVRMVVSDPKYGLNVKPENVIGMSCLLRDLNTQELTTLRKQVSKGHSWDGLFTKERYSLQVTPHILSPGTIYAGKLAAIKEYIHPIIEPILVAGDSPSDHLILFCSDYKKGGLKLWINHNEQDWHVTQEAYKNRAKYEKALGLEATADKNWIMLYPKDLGLTV